MALVVTLILLSVITFMTVTFLATTRRERVSVSVTASQTDAQLMAETALERAKAHVAAQILLRPDPLYFGLVVSRNLDGTGLYDLNTIATNLFFDPRPPVFIDTDGDGAVDDFRFFLNLNRNMTNGRAIYDPSLAGPSLLWLEVAGDPEWIGVLERSGLPHGPNNRFIGRYAFIILPAGKTLDVNFNHNYAKGINSFINTNLSANNSEGFLRNQGFGPWEINLSAFLRDLNPDLWTSYKFNPNPIAGSSGAAFDQRGAMALIRYRYNGLYIAGSVRSAAEYFGTNVFNVFTNDWIDAYANGPLIGLSPELPLIPPSPWPDADESPTNRWPGAESTNQFFQISDFFDTNKMGISFVTNLVAAMAYTNGFDNTTFYRWLAQLGTDTQPQPATLPTFDFASLTNADLDTVLRTNKLNLNYVNVLPNQATNLFLWAPAAFFTNAAQLLLRANMIWRTNGLGVANYYIGETIVRPNFGVTNIQVYPFNEYSSGVHRLLQLAANIYDATHLNIFPSVFRPRFRKDTTGVYIVGYEYNPADDLQTVVKYDLPQLAAATDGIYNNILVYGVPVIVGAKKGFPNFNEFSLLTSVEAVRKMRVDKPSTNAPSSQWQTNQMFFLNIANAFGVEAWNSYEFPLGIFQVFQAYPRRLQLYVSNYMTVTLTNDIGYTRTIGRGFQPSVNPVPIPANNWVGFHFPLTNATLESFYRPFNLRVPLYTNSIFFTNAVYKVSRQDFDTNISNWETNVPLVAPRWDLIVSNKLMYALVDVDATPNRVVDCVLLDNLTASTNITEALVSGIEYISGASDISQMWLTNRASLNAPTLGMVNQIRASLGDLQPPWNNYSDQATPGQDRQKSIDNFRIFLGQPPRYYTGARTNQLTYTNLIVQAPYTAVGNLALLSRWWANDPLVHYTVQDLTDPRTPNPTFVATNVVLTNYTLGELNQRYQPWGGYPRSSAADPFDYEVRVKDPLIYGSDNWEFPTNKFPSPGWLSRVHRGTPWQTVYFKSAPVDTNSWAVWSGSYGTEPTNDWRLADLFTTLPEPNALRGLLSINQTNLPPWSAALSGISVLFPTTNGLQLALVQPVANAPTTNPPPLQVIYNGINRERALRPGGLFRRLSELMMTPELTVGSPYLFTTDPAVLDSYHLLVNDTAYERIPQQILSLLKEGDDARFVIYAYGQSLKPADRSIFLGSPYSQLCTNYQITGEVLTRTVMRFERVVVFDNSNRALTNLHAVVEAFNILPTD